MLIFCLSNRRRRDRLFGKNNEKRPVRIIKIVKYNRKGKKGQALGFRSNGLLNNMFGSKGVNREMSVSSSGGSVNDRSTIGGSSRSSLIKAGKISPVRKTLN